MNKTREDRNLHSEDQLNEQINDKLNELWTGMRNKKKQLLRNLTPSYSRRSQRTLSELNATHNQTHLTNTNSATENQLLKIKEKLASQESGRKIKQTEIQRLKNTISQLTNDKKILIREIQNITNHSISVSHLNDEPNEEQHVDGRTANFYAKDKKKKSADVFSNKRDKSYATESSNKENNSRLHNCTTKVEQGFKRSEYNSLEDLSKARLIELLRSTSEYREFAFYYDSHELSYLKRLQQQHKKNCQTNYSSIEKKYWAPTELYERMKHENARNRWGLNESQVEEVVSEMKCYFEANEQLKLRQAKEYYIKKIDKLKRQKDNKVPYDLVRLSNARERQICKKRAKSIKC